MLVDTVLRVLAGEPRAEGATRIDPLALRVLGLDRARGGRDHPPRSLHWQSPARLKTSWLRWRRRQVEPFDESDSTAVLYCDRDRALPTRRGEDRPAHLLRAEVPDAGKGGAPASDAAADPVPVVAAESGARELRRLLPDLRKAVGDQLPVVAGPGRRCHPP